MLGAGLAPYPCQLSDGDYVFAWNNNSNRISCQKITTTGAAGWVAPIEIQPITAGRTISRPQLVAHTAGKWGMVFQQRNGTFGSPTPTTLFAKQFDVSGNTVWTSTALSNTVTANTRYYSVLAVGDVTYIGYYANPAGQNRFDGFVQRVNGDGSLPWGINGSDFSTEQLNYEQVLNIAYQSASAEIWAVETFSNTTQTQYGIYAQRFNAATGARQLTDNAKLLFPVSANREQTWPTSMGFCADGGLLFMLYSDVSNHIFASKIDAGGNFLWSADKLRLNNTANVKGRYNFSVAANEGVAVWQETRAGSSIAYAQNISCVGNLGSLPVYVEYFNGSRQNGAHVLNWKLTPVSTTTGFISLERSANSRNFESIYSISVPATAMRQPFTHSDIQPLNGLNYYRLKLKDDNGHITYSHILPLLNRTSGLEIISLTPNPVQNGKARLLISSAGSTPMNLLVTDAVGRTIIKQSGNLFAGTNILELDGRSLLPGVYQLTIVPATGEKRVLKLVKE